MIDRETPYLKYVFFAVFFLVLLLAGTNSPFFCDSDSGGQYRDGTCDTTRTVHFGRPSAEQTEAYTRVLQGHVSSFPPCATRFFANLG